MVLQDLL